MGHRDDDRFELMMIRRGTSEAHFRAFTCNGGCGMN